MFGKLIRAKMLWCWADSSEVRLSRAENWTWATISRFGESVTVWSVLVRYAKGVKSL